jgi:hypothetical protein
MNGQPSPATRSPTPSAPASAPPGWVESLPFFMLGGASIALAAVLLALHSPTDLAHLPVWTFLVAIGSISLVGGTVATFVTEPIPDLPEENELVGTDLIVVSRARWKDLNKMERWVEERLVASPELAVPPQRPAPRAPARRRKGTQAVPQPSVPTIDDLLADLPRGSGPEADRADLWRETEESREVSPSSYAVSPAPSDHLVPPTGAPNVPPPAPRPSGRGATLPPAARAEAGASPLAEADLEKLLDDLEAEATKVAEEREIASLAPSGLLLCAGCGRSVGITERWEHCDECFSVYCDACDGRLVRVGDRALCPTCRPGRRTPIG